MNASLILEGGTFRSIYTAGILDTFLAHDIRFPYTVGISAGALAACSFASRQPERTLRVFRNYRHDTRYMGWRNLLKERSYFGLDFAYNYIPNVADPFDWEAFYTYEGELEFGLTHAETGDIHYANALEMNRTCDMLQATCAIPLVFPEIQVQEEGYFDGGLADPIPLQRAIDKGFNQHVIVLTRPKGYRKTFDRQAKFGTYMLRKKYPNIAKLLTVRAERYNATIERIEQLERSGEAVVFRPEYALNSFEKDAGQMNKTYQMGRAHGEAKINTLFT